VTGFVLLVLLTIVCWLVLSTLVYRLLQKTENLDWWGTYWSWLVPLGCGVIVVAAVLLLFFG
jgi:hypothetical protein